MKDMYWTQRNIFNSINITKMKRCLLVLVLLLSLGNLYAQHIEFMGIQLGQPRDVVNHMIVRKGYRFVGSCDTFDLFTGRFWNFKNVSLSAHHDFGKVTCITIHVNDKTNWSDKDKLVASLKKKYGSPIGSEPGPFNSEIWKVNGGHIRINAFGFSKDEVDISIDYIDRTSIGNAINDKGRTIDDDL